LADRGARLVVVGSGTDDARAARALLAAARAPVVDLVDRLSLPALTGLLESCSLVVANDSGPRHLAAAVGAPSVGVFLAPNALSAGPLTARRARIAVSYRTRCPGCEQDQRWSRCPHDASLVADVEVDEVLLLARELYDAEVDHGTRRGRAFPSSAAG
jgi:ADP-heptose:LPS heptosyltransferase